MTNIPHDPRSFLKIAVTSIRFLIPSYPSQAQEMPEFGMTEIIWDKQERNGEPQLVLLS